MQKVYKLSDKPESVTVTVTVPAHVVAEAKELGVEPVDMAHCAIHQYQWIDSADPGRFAREVKYHKLGRENGWAK